MAKRFAYRTAIAGITALAVATPAVAAPQSPISFPVAQAQVEGNVPAADEAAAPSADEAAAQSFTVKVNRKDLNGQVLSPNKEYKLTLQANPAVKGSFTVPSQLSRQTSVASDDKGKAEIKFTPSSRTDYTNLQFRFTPQDTAATAAEPQTVSFTVQPYNEQFDPQPASNPYEVIVGTNLQPHQVVRDFVNLPAGTKHAWAGAAPKLDAPGQQQVTVNITYPDNTTDTVGPFTLVVREETTGDVAKTPLLKSDNPTIFLNQEVNDEAFIKSLFHRPENLDQALKFEWGIAPDSTTPGDQDVTIVISYPADAERPAGTKTIPLTVTVAEKNAAATPAKAVDGDALKIPAGSTPKAKDFIANLDELPERTRFSWVEGKAPKTAARIIGGPLETQTVSIKAAFPDGSEQILDLNVTIVKAPAASDKKNNVPRGVNGQKVPLNSTIGDPASYITNRTELTNVTSYAWIEQPDFTTQGTTIGRIRVTYADGTQDIAVARFIVGEYELWRPASFTKGGIGIAVSLAVALGLQLPFFKDLNTKIQKQIGMFNPHLAGAADNAMGLLGGLLAFIGLIPSALFIADGFKVFLPERVAGEPEARPNATGSDTPAKASTAKPDNAAPADKDPANESNGN